MNISFIIPVCNNTEYLERCLGSIFSQAFPGTEVILVNNGVKDITLDYIQREYPGVIYIANDKNRGAAYARNQGVNISRGEYVVFMDSDAYLADGFCRTLRGILKSLPPNIAGIAPKILEAASDRIFSCGLYIAGNYRVFDIGRNRMGDLFSVSFAIDGPNSCCAIFRRKFLEKAKGPNGYFDEDFFYMFEDADLVFRMKEKGYKSVFMPQLVCRHYENGSGTPGAYKSYLCFRNRLYMVLKLGRKRAMARFFLKNLSYDVPRTLYYALTNRYFYNIFRDISGKYKQVAEKAKDLPVATAKDVK